MEIEVKQQITFFKRKRCKIKNKSLDINSSNSKKPGEQKNS